MKILIIAYLLTWAFIPWVLFAGKRPVSTLAWIWAVILFPFAGPLAYLLFGIDRVTRARVRQHQHAHAETEPPDEELRLEAQDARLFDALAKLSELPPSSAQELRLLPDAAAFYPALQQSIEAAKHHVHVQFFVWQDDAYGRRFRDLLAGAARRGVIVRLLVDRLGSLRTRRRFFRPLVEAGGHFAWFRSLNPLRRHFSVHLRNHRKLQIIDGRTAFVGGMNIGREYAGEDPQIGRWRDFQIELRGGIVASLQHVFAEDWFFASDEKIAEPIYFTTSGKAGPHATQVILGGPDLWGEPMADSMAALLHHAGRRAWVATGYFVPDALLLSALRLAAVRGVDVRLLCSKKSDHAYVTAIGRSYYEQLMQAGVRIYEYTPGLQHAKAMLIDEALLTVGSANCDNRSLRLNFELNVLAHCPDQALALEAAFLEDFSVSHEITLDEFRRRPFRERLLEAVVRPLAPMI